MKNLIEAPEWFGWYEIFMLAFGNFSVWLLMLLPLLLSQASIYGILNLFVQPFMVLPYGILVVSLWLIFTIWNSNLRKKEANK